MARGRACAGTQRHPTPSSGDHQIAGRSDVLLGQNAGHDRRHDAGQRPNAVERAHGNSLADSGLLGGLRAERVDGRPDEGAEPEHRDHAERVRHGVEAEREVDREHGDDQHAGARVGALVDHVEPAAHEGRHAQRHGSAGRPDPADARRRQAEVGQVDGREHLLRAHGRGRECDAGERVQEPGLAQADAQRRDDRRVLDRRVAAAVRLEQRPDAEQQDTAAEREHGRLQAEGADHRAADQRPDQRRSRGGGVHDRERAAAVGAGHRRDQPREPGGPGHGGEEAVHETQREQLLERGRERVQGRRRREQQRRADGQAPRAHAVGQVPGGQGQEQHRHAVGAQHQARLGVREAELVLPDGDQRDGRQPHREVEERERRDQRGEADLRRTHVRKDTGGTRRTAVHATRYGRPRSDGREHGAPRNGRRSQVRRVQPQPRTRAGPRPARRDGSESLADLVSKLAAPRHVWVMVPAGGATESTVTELGGLLSKGDTIIDGGNSYYKDDVRRSEMLAEKGINYLDVGTSGGIWGLERGYCLMIGGPKDVVQRMDPIFASLAPGPRHDRGDARPRGPHQHRRERLPALRPVGRGALREDDPQRHRVRPDAGVRRGLRHLPQRQLRGPAGQHAVRPGAGRHRRGVAPRVGRLARGCST